MPKSAWSGRVWARQQRSPHMLESSTARSTKARVAGYPGHWSSCMQMSLPSFSAMAMLSSGVQKTWRPSYSTARKPTPSSVSFMNSPWEET